LSGPRERELANELEFEIAVDGRSGNVADCESVAELVLCVAR
jgi:hypothetical protein